MGCWNKTCGVSGLPIRAGEKVLMLPLEQNSSRGIHGVNDLWHPMMYGSFMEYNDYGAGENWDHHMNVIVEYTKSIMAEKEQGENKSHDIPVTKEGFDAEMFFEAVHEQRLEVHSPMLGNPSIDFVMVRQDMLDTIFAKHRIEVFGMSDIVSGSYNEVVEHVPEFIGKLLEECEVAEKDSGLPFGISGPRAEMILHDMIDGNTLPASLEVLSRIVMSAELGRLHGIRILKLVRKAESASSAVDMFKMYLRVVFLSNFMTNIRKQWKPAGFEGSQHQDAEPYRVLIEAMEKSLTKMESFYDDYY